ncbi:FAD-dependent oxidoreductase [Pseudoalteromonas sp. B530]|uniref:FAD-dependent oxidoreductase n=1 Tax=Pseudoalteromonas sp. B530 TaxID=2994390 RepID=UPI00224B1285|nr:FAD-dependent oxidoreductase [Pseudoalteromonas sp. B530]MCX2766996.1 FAD-binding protein [Pseudoalteromonas sp. B530]
MPKQSNKPIPEYQLEEAQKRIDRYWRATQGFILALESKHGFSAKQLLTLLPTGDTSMERFREYQAKALIFNTRFQFSPSVIVMCNNTDDVMRAYQEAIAFNLPIRVRSGGHDHEGECSGTDVVLLDLSGLKDFSIEKEGDDYIAHIGSGYRFYQLVPKLAESGYKDIPPLTIPHGTCATVGLAGYIQGGGWGPWTRAKGMCCESLVGATVILQDGSRVEVSETENEDLLWALRGGGALSYGIVTEFRVKAFELPDEIHRFEINWNNEAVGSTDLATWQLLSQWEDAINDTGKGTENLVGTNLKINAIPDVSECEKSSGYEKALAHPSTMYGYWQGSEKALLQFAKQYFPTAKVQVTGTDTKQNYSEALMSDWSRNSLANLKKLGLKGTLAASLDGEPFTPDFDAPAPHKITSKLVRESGLTEQGKLALLRSLTSPLLFAQNAPLGLFSYVTLGAIAGKFYANDTWDDAKERVAFPYTTAQYTIQYQTWWNTELKYDGSYDSKRLGQANPVYRYVNRALDWIEVSRDTTIEGAYGAFISFKDASIPTQTYFQENYEKLIEIKEEYSGFTVKLDCGKEVYVNFNRLRTRKTII